ncbi:MAG: hypothetical protein JKX85_09315, partial [Phycisphaeraceae bacterium]|nr:hypothetical protein [Phycisphaeraceae bacterium]
MAVSLFEPDEKPPNAPSRLGDGGLPAAPTAGDAAASPRLEDYNNKRNFLPTGRVYLKPCNCRCRTCPDCGPKFGIKVRCRLLQKQEYFPRPAMFTLTVDRNAFGSPLDAYTTITQGGFIRRLMRLLKVERWAWTQELQMKTGEGWPHWHRVINLPPGGVNLERAWRLWRDKWHLGGLDLQRKPNKSAKHALFYVTKYLTKYPEAGFPDWLLHYDHRVRWVGGTRSLGPLVSDQEMVAKDVGDDEQAKESLPREHRPLALRMAECGQVINFFVETQCNGELYQSFYGRMPREQVIAATHKRSMLPISKDEDGKDISWAIGKVLQIWQT